MNTLKTSHRLWPWIVAALACGLVLSGYGQDAPDSAPAVRWEYSELAWEPADSLALLRAVTGADELVSPLDLAEKLKAEGRELRYEPKAQDELRARLQARLTKAGEEGWDAYWIREGEVRYGPSHVPTVSVLLKRRLP